LKSSGPESAPTAEIESCIRERAFRLAYQPILHLDTGSVAGVEALCRFTDGASTEHRFQQCETLGLAADLDLAIIEAAMADLPHLPDGYLSINLSPSTLLDPRLGELLLASDVPAERVVVEVTEHARVQNYEEAEKLLAALRDSGIRLAVDDAGAGYATFRHILSLRPDIIKMDRSITQDIDSDTARRALATALVIFGGEIGATIIAEGVETRGEILALRRAGIHRAQGFALAPPALLPLSPVDYKPVALANLLDVPSSAPGISLRPAEGDKAHGLLAALDAIGAVLDMLNERLAAIGEERYRGLVGTAQRQARHVGGALRDMVRALPEQTLQDSPEAAGTPGPLPKEDTPLSALRRVGEAAEAAQAAQALLERTVSTCRQAGATWNEIAQVLGMTRQGASKRFSRGHDR
jgi:EAL domain-containing protein (putative c-di-GMP-specific phosphodiesterase class I)